MSRRVLKLSGGDEQTSVAALSLIPIETCLKSVLTIKWQEGRAAGDSSLLPRAWPWAGRHAVALCFASWCAGSCGLSPGTGSGEEDVPLVALFWLLILGEVGILFWKRDCMPAPREGVFSTQPPREPGSRKRDWEIPEESVLPAGLREEGKTDFSSGLRGTTQGSLQTRSLVELTESYPRGWDLPCEAMDGKEEICLHLIRHSCLSLHKKFILHIKHNLRELRLSWWF